MTGESTPRHLLRLETKLKRAILRSDGQGAHFLLDRAIAEGVHTAYAQKASLYESGCGTVRSDFREAIKWYKKSVEVLDDILSHKGLARIYLQCSDLDNDRSLARYHLEILANSDDVGGRYGLGLVYQLGIGVDKDLERALQLHSLAAEQRHIGAALAVRQIKLQKDFTFRLFVEALGYAFLRKVVATFRPNNPRVTI